MWLESPLDISANASPDHDIPDAVVTRVPLVADVPVRTQHRPLWQRSVQAFRDFRLRQPSIAAKRHVEVVLPVSSHYDGGLVLGNVLAFSPSAAFAWLAPQVPAAFVGPIKERLGAFGYS